MISALAGQVGYWNEFLQFARIYIFQLEVD